MIQVFRLCLNSLFNLTGNLLLLLLVLTTWCSRVSANPAHPVITPNKGSEAILMGGVIDGKWRSAKSIKQHMNGGESYHLYDEKCLLGMSTGSKPRKHESVDQIVVDLSQGDVPYWIAIAGDWDAMPRKAKSQSTKQKAYLRAVKKVLMENGLPDAAVNITQVFRFDLEGDRQEEVLITATSSNFDPWVYRKGQYSFVMMRKIVKGHVRTSLLEKEFHLTGVSGVDKPVISEDLESYPESYSIAGFWDVDGDGILEVGISWECPRADVGGTSLFKVGKDGTSFLLAEAGIGN